MKSTKLAFFVIFLIQAGAFSQPAESNYLYRCNEKLTEVIMEDVFTPPVASRVHVYPNIAAYEVLCKKNPSMRSLSGQLKDLESIPDATQKVDYSISAFTAFAEVAKKLVYSEFIINEFKKQEYTNWLAGHGSDSLLLNQSVDYGMMVAQKIIAWLAKDNYNYTRTLVRYVLADSLGAWQPTQPDYANALEPNWPLLRSFVFDSSNVIKNPDNFAYSEKKNSPYYRNAMETYEQSLKLDSVKKSIALFWDCNPNITKSQGHFTYFIHKISPPGHWIRIAGQAIKNRHLDEYETAKIYTMLSLANFEGIINCWTAKYKTNAVRPETYINRVKDPKWKPFIETPPFPEYTSGHSVISGASAAILTALIEQPYSFSDSSEMYIDLPPRYFNNFTEAAEEAAISRFYGGIHYKPSLARGLETGKAIARYLLENIQLSKPK